MVWSIILSDDFIHIFWKLLIAFLEQFTDPNRKITDAHVVLCIHK